MQNMNRRLYTRLPYGDALRLRRYRFDQHSETFEKVKFRSTRRLQHSLPENIPSRTNIYTYGYNAVHKREPILTGSPVTLRHHSQDKYKNENTIVDDDEKNGEYSINVEDAKLNNFYSYYGNSTNIFSVNKEDHGDQNTRDNNKSLQDEIPLEEYNYYQDATFRSLGNNVRKSGGLSGSERILMRLEPAGCKNRKYYNLFMYHYANARISRNKFYEPFEHLGSYDPIPNRWGQKLCGLNVDRIKYWIACGAHPDIRTRELLGLAGILPISPDTKIRCIRLKERKDMEQKAETYLKNQED